MSRNKSNSHNAKARWSKIQAQFKVRIAEKTPSGAKPSFKSVVNTLAEEWCLSPDTIEGILRKEL
jgi:hypothetical protein